MEVARGEVVVFADANSEYDADAIEALVGCFEALRVSGSAESVGRLTTRSVVESIFLVIIFDALFSILFSYLGY